MFRCAKSLPISTRGKLLATVSTLKLCYVFGHFILSNVLYGYIIGHKCLCVKLFLYFFIIISYVCNFRQSSQVDNMETRNIIFKSLGGDGGNRMVRIVQEILARIKEEIKNRKGLTQKKVARKIGVSSSEFSKILAGDRPFKVTQLIKIAEIFDMKIEELFPGDERIDIEKMSMLEMVRIICKREIEKYLIEHRLKI